MSPALLLVLVAVTVASRVLPMTLLPAPRGRAAEVVAALPAPLFAGLAAHALVGDGSLPSLPVLVAGAGAVLGALRRSLGLALVLGLSGFLLARVVLV